MRGCASTCSSLAIAVGSSRLSCCSARLHARCYCSLPRSLFLLLCSFPFAVAREDTFHGCHPAWPPPRATTAAAAH